MRKSWRIRLYHLLVNRNPGIRERYLHMRKEHPGKGGRLLSWGTLLVWNGCCLLGFKGRYDTPFAGRGYERKRLALQESAQSGLLDKESLMKKAAAADVISFDVFDTLLVRPFSQPTDLFYFLGMEFSCPDFRTLRIEAEEKARYRKACGADLEENSRTERGRGTEVTLEEIWRILEKMTGIPCREGMAKEKELEMRFCFANPVFTGVIEKLKRAGKRVIALSDMYLDEAFVQALLKEKGYGELDACFVSSKYGASKAEGTLYELARRRIERNVIGGRMKGEGTKFLHIGDNRRSDIEMARRAGWDTFWYPNPQERGNPFRPQDMSAVTGSMYRGTVNLCLHAGHRIYSPFYEYGYVYGGILALGYCQFIHAFVCEKDISSVWFLARDGEILKRVYERLYPEEKTAYVFWSRGAAARLLSDRWRQDFFERFLLQKTGQGYSMEDIFRGMELEHMLSGALKKMGCREEDELSPSLAGKCRAYLEKNWEEVQASYREERAAARLYLTALAGEDERIAVADIGWAGSGAVGISRLLREEYGLSCQVYGLLGGTNTCHNARPDTAESFFFEGSIASYLFSQQKNRDLWKFHDLNRKHNLYVELLFTSASPTLKGFCLDEEGRPDFCYGRKEAHGEEICKIQKGILDFVEDYGRYFPAFFRGEKGRISGRDAYGPLLLFLQDKKVQRQMERLFCWDTSGNAQ